MSKKVFVTGGAGYIGSHTCVELLKSNHSIMVYDNLSNGSLEALKRVETLTNKKLKFVEGDICNFDFLEQSICEFQPDIVLHFAGLKAVGESVTDPLRYYEVNLKGSLNILGAMSLTKCNKLVFSSSATVYGDKNVPPYKETGQLQPVSPYGRTKLIFEQILQDWVKSDKKHRAIALRYFNPVGAHESGMIGENPQDKPDNLMPFLAQVACKKRQYLSIFGIDYPTKDGTGVRDFIHVTDLALGHAKAIEKIERLERFQILNLGTGKGTTVLELIKSFETSTGIKVPLRFVARRAGDVAISLADPTEAENLLNFKCEKTIQDMCVDEWNWQTKNPNGY